MRISTYKLRVKMELLRLGIVYPLTHCKAEPLAVDYVPLFEGLLTQWEVVHAKKLALDDKTAVAQAKRDRAKIRLVRAIERVSVETLALTGGDRGQTTYTHFFGDRTLTTFKKYRLTRALEEVRSWPEDLAKLGQPSLEAATAELTTAIEQGKAADALKAAVEDEKAYFRDFGERRQLVDKTNAVRKSVHGELGKLPHEMIGLATDFADRFFRPERDDDHAEDEEDQEPTIESVTRTIKALEKEIAEAEALREALKAKKVEDDKADAAREADKAQLLEIRKGIEEQQKLAAELEAKLEM